MNEPVYEKIIHYHETTKHHYHRFAQSSGYLDWDTQPNPFRFYQGEEPIALPFLVVDSLVGSGVDLYLRENNKPQSFSLESIGGFLELGLGLSAWKAVAPHSKWSLRMNPSSGNLHPTEAHLVLPPMPPVQAGVYHYNVFQHALEPRASIPDELWQKIHHHFKTDGFLIGLSSIFWRESWKYGERAFRYCNHDVGHALACLSFSANLQGWQVTYLNGLADAEIETILGFDQTEWPELEQEHPDVLCFVHNHQVNDVPRSLPHEIVEGFAGCVFTATPNTLSPEHVNWEIIYETAELVSKPHTDEQRYDYGDKPLRDTSNPLSGPMTGAQIIRQRRSAMAYNILESRLTLDQFVEILDKTLPRNHCAPFDVQLIEPAVHLLLFVHNVEDLSPGLYFFFRNERDIDEIKRLSRPEFAWQPVLENFPLYLLKIGDVRSEAIQVSCQQEIAGYSAFSLGMIAKFKEIIAKAPYRYRHLFWETGMIGQVLYLEAEAHGVSGTGIGCFFDDPVHQIMGLTHNAYQSLYHFTIGQAIEDTRLTTYPPYHHLQRGTT